MTTTSNPGLENTPKPVDSTENDQHDELPEDALAAIDLALAEHETPDEDEFVIRLPVSVPTAPSRSSSDRDTAVTAESEKPPLEPASSPPGDSALRRLIPSWRPRGSAPRNGSEISEIRAEAEQAKARLAEVEQALAHQAENLRDAEAKNQTQVGALEALTAEQIETAVGKARAELTQALAETTKQYEVALAAARTELAATEARRARLEQDLAGRVEEVRQKADAALAARIAAVETQAAGQVESARRAADAALAAQETDLETQAAERIEVGVREAQAEAAQMLVETMKQHEVELATVLAEAQADVVQAEGQLDELKQEFADRVETQAAGRVDAAVRQARDEAERTLAETSAQHHSAIAELRTQLEDAEAGRKNLEQELATRVEAFCNVEAAHAAQLATLEAKTTEQLEAVRREGDAALAERTSDLEARAAEQVEEAMRQAREEAAQTLAEAAEAALITFEGQLPVHVNGLERVDELERQASAFRTEADLAQAELERLHAEHANQIVQARQQVRGHYSSKLADLQAKLIAVRETARSQQATLATQQVLGRSGLVQVTGAVALAGFAGTVIGWCLIWSGIF